LNNLPDLWDIARAWSEGELPLLSRSAWRGGALEGEYPSGVFAPLPTLCALVAFRLGFSLPLAAALLASVHLAVLAAGTFRLARMRGLAADGALLTTLIASLSGFTFIYGGRIWTPCLVGFAWLPWFWWAQERSLDEGRGPARFVWAGVFLALIVTGGWHFTVLMAGILSVWLALRTWARRKAPLRPGEEIPLTPDPSPQRGQGRQRRLWPLAAAWAVGLGLSAPAWLMFLEYLAHTTRGRGDQVWFSDHWMVSPDNLPNLIFPHFISFSPVYHGSPHMGIELAGGLVPLVILLAALFGRGPAVFRTLRWECGLCAVAFLLMTSPSFGNARFSFRWLPLFFLALAMLAAQTLALLRAQPEARGPNATAPNLGAWCFFLVLAVWCRGLMLALGPMRMLSGLAIAFLVASLVWLRIEKGCAADSFPRRWAASAMVLATCWLSYAVCAPFLEIARWQISERIREPAPLDPSVRYMSLYTRHDLWDDDRFRVFQPSKGIGEELYVGNTAMYAGLDFVSGYSPMGPAGIEEVLPFRDQGFSEPKAVARILEVETAPGGLLDLLGVDGLVVAERFGKHRETLREHGWEEVARVEGGLVFHRKGKRSSRVRSVTRAEACSDRAEVQARLQRKHAGPVPLILLDKGINGNPRNVSFAPARLTAFEETRNAAAVEVASPDGEALIVFSRLWYPGYRAFLDGKQVPVELADLMLPAVRIPAGTEGRLVLEYRPRTLILGAWASAGTGVFVISILLLAFVRRHGRVGAASGAAPLPRAQPGSRESEVSGVRRS
jgi:hypothetical protein